MEKLKFLLFISFSLKASSFPYPVGHQTLWIQPSQKTVVKRLKLAEMGKAEAEPIELILPFGERGKKELFSLQKNKELQKKICAWPKQKFDQKRKIYSLTLSSRDLCWIHLSKLAKKLGKKTIEPYFVLNPQKNPSHKSFSHYLANPVLEGKLLKKMQTIKKSKKISMKSFLPPHARATLHSYSAYRGRNCFVTALGFFHPKIEKSSNLNILHFPGHHSSMMNHDEFLHTLFRFYTRVSKHSSRLGDVYVFFDRKQWPSYKSVMHAAVKIAGPYFFHKGSKFTSTPIEFVHQRELFSTWQKHIKHLGVHVYRPKDLLISKAF
jgi:hypothetical protein